MNTEDVARAWVKKMGLEGAVNQDQIETLGSFGTFLLAEERRTVSGQEACKHEPFEGRCVHCDAPFVNGIAAPIPATELPSINAMEVQRAYYRGRADERNGVPLIDDFVAFYNPSAPPSSE